MSVTTGSVLRIVCSMLWTDGNVNQNIFNAVVTGGGGPWDDQDILDDAEAWADDMYLNLTAFVSDHLAGNAITVYKWDVSGQDWDEVGSNSWSWTPENADEQLPRGVAGLVRLWTEDPDVQGKKYVPGLCEANLVDGLWSASLVTALLAFGADWLLAFVGGTSGASWAPVVWSVVGKVAENAVDHIATSTIPAYQRRRKRNVGI